MDKLKKYALYFLVIVYVSGAMGFIFNPSFFNPFTPYTLLFTCLVFIINQPISDIKFLIAFFGIALFGFIFEVVGVKTSLVFGSYYYGSALGYKVLEVPIIISLNWAMIVSSSIIIASKCFKNRIVLASMSALISTTLDFIIEQVAFRLDFWYFRNTGVGLHNYIAWFVISFIASLLFATKLAKGNYKIALIIILLQLFFFGFIYTFI